MIFQFKFILGIPPFILLIPSIIFQVIFLRDYFKTKQKMFGFLAILFSTYIVRNIFQVNRLFSLPEGEAILFLSYFRYLTCLHYIL